MARPERAVAMTLLLIALPLLLLPAPALSQAAAAAGAIFRSPVVRQLGWTLFKQASKGGGEAIFQQVFAGASASASASGKEKLMGAAAADAAAYIVYNVSIAQRTFYGVVDITNAFLWVQCPPAFRSLACESNRCTYALGITAAKCDASAAGGGDCSYVYGSPDSGTSTTGYLAVESFTVGDGTIAGDVLFGCSSASTVTGENLGAIGFNQGGFSILQQLQISRFSYFLTPDDSSTPYATSVVLLGAQAVPQTTRSRTTRLIVSKAYPGLYYFVELVGIQVDGVWLPGVPAGAFDLAVDGRSGGVVLSTTTFVTYLQKNAYYSLRQVLTSKIASGQVRSSNAFDLCYYTQSVAKLTFPKITLVFAGADSPSMNLTTVHYFFKDNSTGLQCLTILPTPDDTPFGSILGSMLQAGTNMIYDTGAGLLMFENGKKATQVSLMVVASLPLVWVLLF